MRYQTAPRPVAGSGGASGGVTFSLPVTCCPSRGYPPRLPWLLSGNRKRETGNGKRLGCRRPAPRDLHRLEGGSLRGGCPHRPQRDPAGATHSAVPDPVPTSTSSLPGVASSGVGTLSIQHTSTPGALAMRSQASSTPRGRFETHVGGDVPRLATSSPVPGRAGRLDLNRGAASRILWSR